MPFRLSIRTKLGLAILALTVLTVGVSVALSLHRLSLYINEQAEDELLDDLQSIQLILRLQQKDARAGAGVLALRGDLQAALAAGDHEEVLRIVEQYRTNQGIDTLTIVDAEGVVIARGHRPDYFGDHVSDQGLGFGALTGASAETLVLDQNRNLLAIGSVPIFDPRSSDTILGAVIAGYTLDQEFVESLKRSTGEDVSLILDNRRRFTTLPDTVGSLITVTDINTREPIEINDDQYYAVYSPLQGQYATTPLGFLEIAKSNASIQETTRDIIGGVIVLMSAVGLVALGLAFAFSSRLTRPLDRLTEAARSVGRSDFTPRIEIHSGDELEVLAEAFNHMSENIQHTQAESDLRAQQQAALADLGRTALAGMDGAALRERVVTLLSHFLNVEYTKILELTPDRTKLRLVAGVGWNEGTVGHALVDVSKSSQVGQTLMSVEPVIILDAPNETRFELPEHLTEHNVVSGVSVAINSGEEVYGILGAYTGHHRTFSDDQIHFMQAVANVLAAAISRRQAEVALRESEARYRQLIELSPEMIVVYDDEQVLYTNQAGASLIEEAQLAQIIGKPDLDVSGAIRSTQEHQRQPEYRRNGKRVLEGQLLRQDGDTMYFEVTSAPIPYMGRPAHQAIVRDVTERKRAEEQLQQYTARLEALYEIDRAILMARSPQEIARAALSQLRRLVPSVSASVVLFDFEANTGHVMIQDIDSPSEIEVGSKFSLDRWEGIEQLRGGKSVWLDAAANGADEAMYRMFGQSVPARSYIAMPLITHETLIGSLNLGVEGRDALETQHVDIIDDVATQLAVAIQQARLYEQVQSYNVQLEQRVAERTAELVVANKLLKREIREHRRTEQAEREQRTLAEALRDTSAALNRTLDLDEVVERILNQLGRVVPHDVANIMLVEAGHARIVGSRGYSQRNLNAAIVTQRYSIHEAPNLQRMALSRRPLAIPDTSSVDADEWNALPETAWLHSYAGAPIVWNEEIIGFINLESATPGFFTPEHAERLGAFADQASIAIRNAQLFAQAQELATLQERQRLAHELHDAVSQTLWSASLIADVLPSMWEADPDRGREKLNRLKQLTRGALAEMRTLLLELRPTALVEVAMDDLLRQLAESSASRTRAAINLDVEQDCVLPPDVQMTFYRVAQESLSNIARHSMATEINIRLSCSADTVELVIKDNGQGFDPNDIPAGHFGLGIMKERASAIGATCEITSTVGQGTQVRVTWTQK